jgi:hypothetical protein
MPTTRIMPACGAGSVASGPRIYRHSQSDSGGSRSIPLADTRLVSSLPARIYPLANFREDPYGKRHVQCQSFRAQ